MAESSFFDTDAWSFRSAHLEVRLAAGDEEVEQAQALRFHVFYEEMAARPDARMAALRRDVDGYDAVADHLLVLDHRRPRGERVVGTYRLIRRSAAARMGHFYSTGEYDVGKIIAHPGEILELGRSCVHGLYRNGQTMQLLWRGIATYVMQYDIEIMFGCASLPGVDIDALRLPLSYLYYYHLAPPALRPVALADRHVDMRLMSMDAIDQREAIAALPPLIKGYLRIGGHVGDGAVVDEQFQTTDVAIIVKTDLVTEKYFKHYEMRERRPVLAFANP
jgi:putative hemolysin